MGRRKLRDLWIQELGIGHLWLLLLLVIRGSLRFFWRRILASRYLLLTTSLNPPQPCGLPSLLPGEGCLPRNVLCHNSGRVEVGLVTRHTSRGTTEWSLRDALRITPLLHSVHITYHSLRITFSRYFHFWTIWLNSAYAQQNRGLINSIFNSIV